MTICISQNNVILRNHAMPDNLVGRRRSAQHIERPVRAKDARRIPLTLSRGPQVIQPRSQRRRRDPEIRPHDVLAEKLVKLHTDRVLQIGNPAHVPRSVPRIRSLIGVLFQLAKIGRQQLLMVALHGKVHAVRDERRRVAE